MQIELSAALNHSNRLESADVTLPSQFFSQKRKRSQRQKSKIRKGLTDENSGKIFRTFSKKFFSKVADNINFSNLAAFK